MKGHTTNYLATKVQTNKKLDNEIRKVKITKLDELELIGTLENP